MFSHAYMHVYCICNIVHVYMCTVLSYMQLNNAQDERDEKCSLQFKCRGGTAHCH